MPKVEDVQVVSLPLDIGERNSLTGDAVSDGASATATFELQIILEDRVHESG